MPHGGFEIHLLGMVQMRLTVLHQRTGSALSCWAQRSISLPIAIDPFASLRVTRCDCSNGQGLFFTIEPCFNWHTSQRNVVLCQAWFDSGKCRGIPRGCPAANCRVKFDRVVVVHQTSIGGWKCRGIPRGCPVPNYRLKLDRLVGADLSRTPPIYRPLRVDVLTSVFNSWCASSYTSINRLITLTAHTRWLNQ
jgi:hypothetical protein